MMKRQECLKALARHVTDTDIVLPVYSTASIGSTSGRIRLIMSRMARWDWRLRMGWAWRSGGPTSE
jgi:hypothetical protein